MRMQTALALVEKHAKYVESACSYGEPGYDDALNDPTKCNLFKVDFAALGFEQFNGTYETGFHPGQNDDPRKVFKLIRAAKSGYDVVFDLTGKGQFDCAWTAWIRPEPKDDDSD